MTEIFKMPDIGEGMAEGDITSWLIKVGDVVAMDDPVAEVQNDKLIQEILSPYGGKVTKLFVEAGTTVEVGDSLIEFDGDGNGEAASGQEPDTVENKQVSEVSSEKPTAQTETIVQVANGHVLAMPSVRHLAYEKGLDLTKITPSGRHGHVTLSDVEKFQDIGETTPKINAQQVVQPIEAVNTKNSSSLVAPEPLREGRQPLTAVRRAIAKAMSTQNANIPAVTNFDSVEVSKLVAHRQAFKTQAANDGIRLTYLAYVVKALAATAKKFPELNASLDMTTQEVIYHDDVNMGIAVSAPSGLYVPVIGHADQKSILTIASEISELAEAVRTGTIRPQQMQGGTITISNLGSARGTWFTPIISGEEVAILGLGSILKEPIVNENGDLAIGQNMKLSLSYDHRLIDGMLGQSAMNYLKQLLADPAYMLMEV
ncbi:2-oxo acid dehydrogenase subunit E2 [Leuconostoc gelidum subsp. gelidum]|uniref:Dihydrolipoamide acetyltransferase component of pyruvate dehydrogenase complex n=1 Tax=Leuconostoc gelidum subsp. gelidum TaxID=1607839 RepID=A0AB35G0A4_LEUGE|nr:dihydrolipoamide acetyltransferase family protein [Leuconostoc gelidum]MBZ5963938.1 2-oxo acid dehydrogenase subunit E2 [Leuconostoc gelidum subsp. gelidum]MBZ5975218.1 2-oxo acid dehydrogenase subunit E2 [Leuconostoc gelidum subsp. gelidum]MBZ5976611.1 2-oxo acid dehydrogenase subunit E2 [Leuconostoc gelidum subsp. gelidum]MBZ5985623.1 2-oxo acid dehydrogenase subunit E2 [Leuconostoc gelidum subsp. gelidum]MBZ6000591.1 2-oxo acid dehydrogenase subunit E2 [Leuconostoc gelidum subsp. gelidum